MAEAVVAADDAPAITEIATAVIEDTKGRDMVMIEVGARVNNLFDRLIICTATSSRHASAIAEKLRMALKHGGMAILGVEGPGEMGWTLIDAGSVVVHIFLQEAREHYDLESLWSVTEQGRSEDAAATESV